MSTDFRDLKVGDEVKLVGPDWADVRGQVVTVDRIEEGSFRAWNDTVEGVGSLTRADGYQIDADYAIERVTPARPTTQGYTLSVYVSKTAAAEFPGETQELASITITHDDLAKLLSQGQGILEVVQDG